MLTPVLQSGTTREQWSACAVAPPRSLSRSALHWLGVDVERVELAAATHLRAGVAWALAGVRTRPTDRHPDGVSRGSLIRHCGRQHAVRIGETYDVEPRCCRQRPCPSCARARARRNAADLTRAMQQRHMLTASTMFLFATLTQPKRPRFGELAESPREAVARIVRTWQRITNAKTATGREFRRLFAGGLRTTETTYAPRGAEREHGGAVAFSGYHAHLHVILEVREGIDRGEAAGWLLREWLLHCDGASAAAQCIRPANADDASQLCKYVTKPLEDAAGKPAILRELFGALHGVRLLQAFGEWMARAGVRAGWRELGVDDELGEQPSAPRYTGPEIGELWRACSPKLRAQGTTDRVVFQGRAPGDELLVSACEAWEAIASAVAARVAAAEVRAALAASLQKPRARAGAPPPG